MHSTLNYLSPIEFETHWEKQSLCNRSMTNAANQADGANAGRRKAWKTLSPFPTLPPTLEIDPTDFHIPTVTATTTKMN